MTLPKLLIRLLICCFLLVNGIKLAEAASVVLNNQTSVIHLQQKIETYIDPENTYTVDDILTHSRDIQFSTEYDIFGKAYYPYLWLKFEVTSAVNKSWFLLLEPAWLDRVEFYLVNQQNQVVSKKIFDRHIPFLARDVHYRTPVIRFDLDANVKQTVYLKIFNTNGPVRGIDLLSFDAFVHATSASDMLWGIIFGLYLLLIAGSMAFERIFKDGIYFSFACYVFFCALFNFILTGLWDQFVFPEKNVSQINLVGLVGVWLVYFSIRFYFKYLEVSKVYPSLSKLFLECLLVFTIIYSLVMIYGDQYKMIKLYLILAVFFISPVSIIMMIKPVYQSQSEIKMLFILVTGLYVFSFLHNSLTVLGIFPRDNLNRQASIIFEVFIFLTIYYSLSKKYALMRKDKEDAQRQLLEVSKNTQLELEKQVSSKTKELIRAQEALEVSLKKERKVYQDQRNFVGMVSHELRTPLSIINASIQNLLRNKKITDETVHQKFDNIQVSVKRLTRLIDDYLNNERLDTSSEKIDYEWVSIQTLFEEAILSVEPLYFDHDYEIKLQDSTLILWADKYLLKLILLSLVENAAKYTASGTTISFDAIKTETEWKIIISDNGLGILDKDKPYIFDRYYRGSQSSKHIGTGLGLYLSRQLAELMGGSLTLIDTPDRGCYFFISLPLPAK